jgi:hypothetical protein
VIYWRGRERREAELRRLEYNLSAIAPFNPWGPAYIWDWFTPDHVCPTMERVGRLGDGGKWICDVETLRRWGARDAGMEGRGRGAGRRAVAVDALDGYSLCRSPHRMGWARIPWVDLILLCGSLSPCNLDLASEREEVP